MRDSHIKLLKVAVFTACLAPLAVLTFNALTGRAGADAIAYVTHMTGRWTLRFLLVTLAVSPVRKLARLNWLIRFRRMLGLFAFFYASLHLLTYVWFDKFFDVQDMLRDIAHRKFITIGFLAWTLMVPLAATSTAWAIRKLGGRRWQLLHRLVYLSAVAAVVHFWWLVKPGVRTPVPYILILAVLLGIRPILQFLDNLRKARDRKAEPYRPQLQPK